MSNARDQWTSQCGREQCSSVVRRCGLCLCDDEIVDDQDYDEIVDDQDLVLAVVIIFHGFGRWWLNSKITELSLN